MAVSFLTFYFSFICFVESRMLSLEQRNDQFQSTIPQEFSLHTNRRANLPRLREQMEENLLKEEEFYLKLSHSETKNFVSYFTVPVWFKSPPPVVKGGKGKKRVKN